MTQADSPDTEGCSSQSQFVSRTCDQCGQGRTIWAVEAGGELQGLCLECWKKYNDIMGDLHERNVAALNHSAAMMDHMAGMPPGFCPRFELPGPKHQTIVGEMTLNRIKIDRSAVGVLNTGTVVGSLENIDASIQIVEKDPSLKEVIRALKDMTEAVTNSTDATDSKKEDILEMLSVIAEEVRAPVEKRRTSVLKSILSGITDIAGGIVSIKQVWDMASPIFQSLLR